MGVNFGIEYLYTSAAIKSPVWLHNKARFGKFGRSGTLISNLTKSPLFSSPCFCVSVVRIIICRTAGRSAWAEKTPEICRSEKDRDKKGP